MPERPPDSPEFDWLYGQDVGDRGVTPVPISGADDIEHTRVMPRGGGTIQPPVSPPAAPPAAPPAIPPATPGRTAPAGPPPTPPAKTKRRRPPYGRIVLVLLVAWAAYLVAVPVSAWKNVDKVNAFPSSGRPADQPGTTYLLVGSDSRKGLTPAQNRRLGTGGVGQIGGRTDTIMILHTGGGKPLLLSIPRDSLVPIPGYGTTKINAAFAYGGPKLLIQTIEQDTGLRIDHYIEVGLGGFVNAVDAVGGITICPEKRMVDPRANLNIKKGCQQVNGVTALGYARSRHTEVLGDIARARHQREVVSAIGAKVKSIWSVLNPFRYSSLIHAATGSLIVSKGTGVWDMASFARAMTQVNGTSGLTCSMPIRDLAVHWDHTRALELLTYIKENKTDNIPSGLCTPTGLPQ
ncbi:MAG: cell envelope-related transcriptional attenuator [Marmoricola sp.]|nr:cell envelope-related transcriptional attenuator [Marmoricola sp.]